MRRLGFVVIIGICLIIYIGFGFVYWQQGPKQADLEEQINKTMPIVSKPLPNMEELQAKYDGVNLALAPLAKPDALEIIVGIARESGIDVDPAHSKIQIPPPSGPKEKKMGEGTYQVLSIGGIRVEGDYDSVMSFIADLDSGATMETLVLKKVETRQVEIRLQEKEAKKRAEFRRVSDAVIEMMADNGLIEIPHPLRHDGGIAINDMEAFPDSRTTADEKGYTGTGTPKTGYVLYEHARIFTDNTTEFETVNYITTTTTQYYYTCEADGTVRQFDGPEVATAVEHLDIEEVDYKTVANMDVDLYTKQTKG
jgi:hypothetical protein